VFVGVVVVDAEADVGWRAAQWGLLVMSGIGAAGVSARDIEIDVEAGTVMMVPGIVGVVVLMVLIDPVVVVAAVAVSVVAAGLSAPAPVLVFFAAAVQLTLRYCVLAGG